MEVNFPMMALLDVAGSSCTTVIQVNSSEQSRALLAVSLV